MNQSEAHILVLYAHPAPHRSRINQRMLAAAAELPTVVVHDLYETYPDFHIDVEREQALLTAADLVVFQHPIHWYSMPALMKEWVDVVLEHGWAYGADGNALAGKDYWMVATTGGGEAAYQTEGYHRQPFAAFLPPFEMTARLCGMRWITPLIQHGAHQMDEAAITAHVEHYRTLLATYPHWSKQDSE